MSTKSNSQTVSTFQFLCKYTRILSIFCHTLLYAISNVFSFSVSHSTSCSFDFFLALQFSIFLFIFSIIIVVVTAFSFSYPEFHCNRGIRMRNHFIYDDNIYIIFLISHRRRAYMNMSEKARNVYRVYDRI